MSLLLRSSLVLALLLTLSGCAGAYVAPTAYAPMMKEPGDVRITAGVRPLAPARGMYARATLAATQHLRLGAQVAGASLKKKGRIPDAFGWEDYDNDRLRTLYAEGMAGFELPAKWLSWGLLSSVGYGITESRKTLCRVPMEWWGCGRHEVQQLSGTYLRYGLEGFFGIRPVPWANVAWGMRSAWVHLRAEEIDFARSRARFDFGVVEPFATARAEFEGSSFEVQLRYANLVNPPRDAQGDRLVTPSHLTVTVGFGLRFPRQPGRWPVGYWKN